MKVLSFDNYFEKLKIPSIKLSDLDELNSYVTYLVFPFVDDFQYLVTKFNKDNNNNFSKAYLSIYKCEDKELLRKSCIESKIYPLEKDKVSGTTLISFLYNSSEIKPDLNKLNNKGTMIWKSKCTIEQVVSWLVEKNIDLTHIDELTILEKIK